MQKRDLQGQRHSFWAGFWRRAISVGLEDRAEEIVKFRRVVGSDWLEYIYNV